MHNIQFTILESLINNNSRRFSEMRPARVDSNLFQYHLSKLIKDGYVSKVPGGYTLSGKGLYYADRQSSALKGERIQAKIITLLIIRDKRGRVLVRRKRRQPFIGSYLLPAGKIHEGESVEVAAHRELAEKTGLAGLSLCMSGTVHNTIMQTEEIISEYFGFLFSGHYVGDVGEGLAWYETDGDLLLAPGVKEILADESKGFYEAIIQMPQPN